VRLAEVTTKSDKCDKGDGETVVTASGERIAEVTTN
jgi:hypothetical protein